MRLSPCYARRKIQERRKQVQQQNCWKVQNKDRIKNEDIREDVGVTDMRVDEGTPV